MVRLNEEATTTTSEILIVDDLPENLRLLSILLRREGYRVRCAKNGQMALKSIQFAPPDLILLDIMMPEMDGFEVCQRLKNNYLTTNIPIIFVSASDASFYQEQALLVEGVDYVTKPYRAEQLLGKVQAVLINQLCS